MPFDFFHPSFRFSDQVRIVALGEGMTIVRRESRLLYTWMFLCVIWEID